MKILAEPLFSRHNRHWYKHGRVVAFLNRKIWDGYEILHFFALILLNNQNNSEHAMISENSFYIYLPNRFNETQQTRGFMKIKKKTETNLTQ